MKGQDACLEGLHGWTWRSGRHGAHQRLFGKVAKEAAWVVYNLGQSLR